MPSESLFRVEIIPETVSRDKKNMFYNIFS